VITRIIIIIIIIGPIKCVSREKEKLKTKELITKFSHVTVTAGAMAVSVRLPAIKRLQKQQTPVYCAIYTVTSKQKKKAFYHKVP
jgi:cadmium resistance protein CadD (predicted permease)